MLFYVRALCQSYWTLLKLTGRTFFRSRGTAGRLTLRRFMVMGLFCPALLVFNTVNWCGLLLDELLFPRYRRVRIKAPVFIVGVPRSGTSYLHRVLANDAGRFTTLTLGELLFAPSITQRRLLGLFEGLDRRCGRPVARALVWFRRRAVARLDVIHSIDLGAPEEDYLLLIPLFACYLLILPFPFQDAVGRLAYFDDSVGPGDKDRIMTFYKRCLQRHLYVHGPHKQLLSKNVSFAPMVAALDETFGDCKIICSLRNPLQCVPSHLSAMMAGARIFDNATSKDGFRDPLIALQRYAFAHVADVLPRLPRQRHHFVRMEDLKRDLHATVAAIYDRFGYRPNPAFTAYLQSESRAERNYTSRHTYSVAAFGLTAAHIVTEFGEAFERFGYAKDARGQRPIARTDKGDPATMADGIAGRQANAGDPRA